MGTRRADIQPYRQGSVTADLRALAVLGAGLFTTGYLLRPVRKRRRR